MYQLYIPKVVRAPARVETRYGALTDPGYEGARNPPFDPWQGPPRGGGFAFHWTQRNLQEMLHGRPPWGVDGKKVNLHHRAQQPNGPLDEMTQTQHQQQSKILHENDYSRVNRSEFDGQRARYWVSRARKHLGTS